MITERQIKARFSKPHLRKLVEQMLKEPYYPYKNGKKSETPIPWYELRPGMTVDTIIYNMGFKEIVKSETNSFARLYGEVIERSYRTGELVWFKTDGFRLKEIPGSNPKAYEVLEYRSWNKTDVEKVDSWIKSHLLDRERWMKNNTAIDIYIPWNR